MKTYNKIFTLVVLSLLSTTLSAQWGGKKVVGNGNVTTQTINTPDYDGIAVKGSMDVYLQKGREGVILVETDENIQEYIIVEVSNDQLQIRTKNNTYLKSRKGVKVYVPFESINEVSLTGSGDIETKDPIAADILELSVTGSGDVKLDVQTQNLEATVTGSGDMVLKGTTKSLEARVSGSGDFEATGLRSQSTEITVSGSGDARVNSEASLQARVIGSGDIRYTGNPATRDTKVSGSGSIKAN
jgi:hypothetical protein